MFDDFKEVFTVLITVFRLAERSSEHKRNALRRMRFRSSMTESILSWTASDISNFCCWERVATGVFRVEIGVLHAKLGSITKVVKSVWKFQFLIFF